MIKPHNDSRLVNPDTPVPTLEDIAQRLYPTYSKLFAIWLGINKDKLLLHREEGSRTAVQCQVLERRIRIFLSYPLFAVGEIIFVTYAIVTLCIYLWRPGQYLPRLRK